MKKLTWCSPTTPNYGENKYIRLMSLLWVFLGFTSTIIGCGSAEAIKAYNYELTKDKLEKAVSKVINSNPHIALIPIPRTVVVRRHPNDNSDTTSMVINVEEYTGEGKQSVLDYYSSMTKIKIQVGQIENTYVFRYAGSVQDWKASRNSTIFISEAHDKNGNTLSQGHNERGQFESKLAKGFTDLFETEFINKLDMELNLKHTVN